MSVPSARIVDLEDLLEWVCKQYIYYEIYLVILSVSHRGSPQ